MKKTFCFLTCIVLCFALVSCVFNENHYNSWHLNIMEINKIWQHSKGKTQTIAFIDTGISEELMINLSDRIVYKYNIFEQNENVKDLHGHGTEMVSVACSGGFNDIYGIAPEAKIIIIKAVSDEGKTNNENLYTALKVAQSKGATIVNISLGGYKSDENVVRQINDMIKNNITIVAAAGDYQNKDLLFPANQDGVISVEAFDKSFVLWNKSNHSDDSVIRMPGVEIDVLTLDIVGNLCKETANGTSQASAITSAYVALIRDYYDLHGLPYDNDKIIDILESLNTKNSNGKIDFLLPFN